MGKLFGTDGIRGVVGENLTVDLAFQTGKAIAAVLKEETGRKPLITIGKDTRISSDMLESALIAGICAVGGDVMPFGVLPTPAVAYLTVLKGADAGIVISASHNPYEHNGIKVFNGKGYKLPDATEARSRSASSAICRSPSPRTARSVCCTTGSSSPRWTISTTWQAPSRATLQGCACWWTAPTARRVRRRRSCSGALSAMRILSTGRPMG